MAVGRVPLLGVDVENCGRTCAAARGAALFSPRRRGRAAEPCPPSSSRGNSLRLWTLKEAWLKAVGAGLAGGLGA